MPPVWDSKAQSRPALGPARTGVWFRLARPFPIEIQKIFQTETSVFLAIERIREVRSGTSFFLHLYTKPVLIPGFGPHKRLPTVMQTKNRTNPMERSLSCSSDPSSNSLYTTRLPANPGSIKSKPPPCAFHVFHATTATDLQSPMGTEIRKQNRFCREIQEETRAGSDLSDLVDGQKTEISL